MPPTAQLEDYLELVSAIEQTAADFSMPVVLEGYVPPADWRLQNIKVTPDPGVIEVNIHPAANWRELENNTVALYEEARLTRLATEKFDLDGKHTGTGGGNHIVMGGPTRQTVRSCAAPIFCRACLPTGSTILLCRICLAVALSVRPAKHLASMREDATLFTNFRPPWNTFLRPVFHPRLGLSIDYYATCWSI